MSTDKIWRGDSASGLLARLPSRIGAMLHASVANATPDQMAMMDGQGSWSYQDLSAAMAAAQSVLQKAGVRPGGRVLILGENSRSMAAFILATMALDAVAVPLNPKLTPDEVDAVAAHADPAAVVYCLDGGTRTVRKHAQRHDAEIHVEPMLGAFGLREGDADAAPSHADVALMIYTSGSSGRPKGVELTHRNLLFMAAASGDIRRLTAGDRFYVLLPLSHIVAVAVLLLGGLMHGAGLVLAGRFTPRALLDSLARGEATILLATPALMGLLLDAVRGRPLPVAAPKLRIVSVSGAPLDPTTKAAAEAMFGLPLHQGYGITECAPTVAQMRLDDPRSDLSVGRLLPGMEAKLLRADGTQAGESETGELFVRGPNIMHGYFRAAEETAAVLGPEGWFRTGDLARFDGGNLTVVGRVKEMVIRYGFNVYPAEVEAALSQHPAVQACAVIGRKPATPGAEEELIAFVQPASGTGPAPDEAELARHAAIRLAPYKRPNRIIVLKELPKTPSGKLHKPALLPLAAAEPGT